MARISYPSREQLPEAARAAFDRALDYGPFAHQVGAFAHRPPILVNLYRMLSELREESKLPPRYLELRWSPCPGSTPAATASPTTRRCSSARA